MQAFDGILCGCTRLESILNGSITEFQIPEQTDRTKAIIRGGSLSFVLKKRLLLMV